jgi:amino-acid N-acetyltransferase
MQIRNARVEDVRDIHSLISSYAELDKMLFRSMADIYENLQIFKVAQDNGRVVGCCALKVVWADLAEIKSLAIDQAYFGQGVGKSLVLACLVEGRNLGLKKAFTLTLVPEFFEKVGFTRADKKTFPMKVWSDCATCPKQDQCDETALVIDLL